MINKSESVSRSSDFVYHSYDHRRNWTPLSSGGINDKMHCVTF